MVDLVVLEEETRKMLRSVLLPYRDGLVLADLACEYRNTVGSFLPWRALGHASLLALLLAMPEVVRVERLAAGHMLLHATAEPSTQHIADMVSQQFDPLRKLNNGYNNHSAAVLRAHRSGPRQPVTSAEEQERYLAGALAEERQHIAELLAAFPGGLPAARLLAEYRRLHLRELDMCGAASVLELAGRLADLLALHQEGGEWVLRLATRHQEVEEGGTVQWNKARGSGQIKWSEGELLKMGEVGEGKEARKKVEETRTIDMEVEELVGRIATTVMGRREGDMQAMMKVLRQCIERLEHKKELEEVPEEEVEVVPFNVETGGEVETVHVVRLAGGGRWCTAGEVATLLPAWGGRDLVRKMLRVKRIQMEEVTLQRREKPRLFAEMARCGVRGTSAGEEEVALYRVEDLPTIMKAFRAAGLSELLQALQGVVAGSG